LSTRLKKTLAQLPALFLCFAQNIPGCRKFETGVILKRKTFKTVRCGLLLKMTTRWHEKQRAQRHGNTPPQNGKGLPGEQQAAP